VKHGKKKERVNIRGPFLVNGRKSYYVEVNKKRRSLRTEILRAAKALVAEIKAEYEDKALEIEKEEKDGILFPKFMKQYLEWAEKTQPKSTFKANRLALRKLAPICEGLTMDEITAYHLDQMIAEELNRGLSIGAVNCYVRHSKTVLSQALKWEMIPKHPFKLCKQQRATKKPPKALEKEDLTALFDVIPDCYDYLVIRAYLVTGRSRSELVSLQWSDVDFEKNQYYITRTKTHLSRWYPLGRGFKEVLESIGPEADGPVFWREYHPDTLTHKIKEYMVDAGLGDHKMHHLRHSFARLYLEAGGGLRVLQDLLGHSAYTTTEIYASIGKQHLSDEINRVNF